LRAIIGRHLDDGSSTLTGGHVRAGLGSTGRADRHFRPKPCFRRFRSAKDSLGRPGQRRSSCTVNGGPGRRTDMDAFFFLWQNRHRVPGPGPSPRVQEPTGWPAGAPLDAHRVSMLDDWEHSRQICSRSHSERYVAIMGIGGIHTGYLGACNPHRISVAFRHWKNSQSSLGVVTGGENATRLHGLHP